MANSTANIATGATGAQLGAHTPEISNGATVALNGYPDAFTNAIGSGPLDAKHRAALESESAISPDAITARGYFTSSDRNGLALLGFTKGQQLPPALVIPLYDYQGARQGYAIKPDIPRIDSRSGKAIKYEIPKGAKPMLDFSPLTVAQICDISKPILFTEGAKKADSAASRGLCAVNLNGVWGFQSKGQPLPDWEALRPYLRERVVLIGYDSDVSSKRGVETAMRRFEALLKSFGAVVKAVYLPDGPNGEKTGVDDFFARGGIIEQLLAMARDLESVEMSARKRRETENAAKREALKAKGLPLIETNGRQQQDELDDLSRAIETYNAKKPTFFQGAAGLVLIERGAGTTPTLRKATREAVQGIAGRAANWIRTGEREGVCDVTPPRDLCAIYLALQDQWRGVPILDGVATAPFFAPDGTLCAASGYHASARLWLSLPDGFDVGDTTPTPENIEAARRLILGDILGEVEFADDASLAHAVALMLLPFVRHMIDGPTPLHLFDAPMRSSGKSYTAGLCTLPFGEVAPTAEKGSGEEWRKSLLAKLIEGPSHVFIDNIKGALSSSTLDAAITGDYIEDRATGTGQIIRMRVRCVWVATANNAQLTEDAASRSVVIRLDTNTETPDAREFRGNPKAFIKANRGAVCGALLTLVRAWQDAGAPAYSGPNRCRFPEWAQTLGGILGTAQIGGFLDNLAAQRATLSNATGDEWAQLAAAWHDAHGETYKTAEELLPLAAKISGFSERNGDPVSLQKLRQLLQKRRDQIFDGLKIESGQKIERKSAYRVRKMQRSQRSQRSFLGRESVGINVNVSKKTTHLPKKDGFAPAPQTSATSATSAQNGAKIGDSDASEAAGVDI